MIGPTPNATSWVNTTPADAPGTEAGVDIIPDLDRQLQSQATVGDAAGDWLCAWCHHHVAHDKDRFQFDGRSEFSFANPQGIWFQILTFSEAPGVQASGTPTLDATWFANHAWSYTTCACCGTHLGWRYTGPSEFVGLIRDRLVRALQVMN